MTRRKRTGDVDQGQGSYGTQGEMIIIGEDELKKLGVSSFKTSAKENGDPKLHEYFLLPAAEGDSQRYALDLFIHYGVGSDNASVLCPKLMVKVFESYGIPVPKEFKGGECPICEEVDRRQAISNKMEGTVSKEKKDKWWVDNVAKIRSHYGKSWEPEPCRYLAWVRPGSDESENENIQFFLMPSGVYKDGVLEFITDKHDKPISGLDLANPEKPVIFDFKRSGKGGQYDTKYSSYGMEFYEDEKGSIPMPDVWIENVPHYTDILNFKTYDEIVKIMGKVDVASAADVTGDSDTKEQAEFFEKDLENQKEEKSPRRGRRQVIDPDAVDEEESKEEISSEDSEEDTVEATRTRVRAKRNRQKEEAEAEKDK